MIRLVGLVMDTQSPGPHAWRVRVEIDGREHEFVIFRSPGDLLPVRIQTRPATWDLQVDNLVALRLDRENGMFEAHPGVDGRHNPFPVWGEARVIEMEKICAV